MTASGDSFAVANLLPEPMLLVRVDGEVLRGNTAFANLFGYQVRDLVARPLTSLAVADERDVATYLRRCASAGQLLLGALTIRRGDGTGVPCRCEGALLRSSPDAPTDAVVVRLIPKELSVARFVALTQKIGELSAEIGRRQQIERQLEQERELLQVTLESIGDAVITTDGNAAITFMNRVAESLTGWPLADAAGHPIDDVFLIINENTRAPVENPVTKVLASGLVVGLANHTLLVARDGSERPIDDSGAPIVGDDGRLHGVVLVFRDVTDLRRAEREHATARRAAESANQAKDQFLATLSHELRTPLNAIIGWSRLLTRGLVTPDAHRHGLTVIERNAELQARLVEDLLDLSRITAGQLRLSQELVNVSEVVVAALDSVRPAADAKGVRLSASIEGSLTVVGDAERLQQVVWNLLMNSIKFTHDGGVITLTGTATAGRVRISVRDTGEGFAPELTSRIFEAFTQGDATFSRPHGGLGLGLTIVRRLVEGHGGTVAASSPGIGKGALLEVELPHSTLQPAPAPLREALPNVVSLAGLSILVVDDEADSVELMALVLQRKGARVSTAGSARAALERLRLDGFDVVIADIGMPHEDGYWLIREIGGLAGSAAEVPVIAVTAFASPADRNAALAAGFDAHLPKPVDVDLLVAAVLDVQRRPMASRLQSREAGAGER